MSTTTLPRPVSVEELQRAHRALRAGDFRRGGHRPAPGGPAWDPEGPVLPVVAAAAGVGASTLALALATAAAPSRVIECAGATASGLAGAATCELGRDQNGWVAGTRGPVRIERPGQVVAGPHELPVPPQGEGPGLTVLDLAWDIGTVLAGHGWLARALSRPGPVVLVAPATLTGLARLDVTLTLLAHTQPVVALVGPLRHPRPVAAVLTEVARRHRLPAAGLVTFRPDPRLALRGLDAAALPARLLRDAATLLGRCHEGDAS